ncbi:MAG: sensor domain-containing protein [Mycobacterium sp.]
MVGSVLALLCAVSAGCTVAVGGRAVPADTDGPRLVSAATLPDVLLDAATTSAIMGTSGMTVANSRSQMFDAGSQFVDPNCMANWTAAEQSVYAQTGWTAMVAQTLLDPPPAAEHFVVQAVVAFPSRDTARSFFDRSVQRWMPCGDQIFTTSPAGSRTDTSWKFDTVSDVDATLWMTQRQLDSSGWSCQRALRVANNVAIDVLACKAYVGDEAVTIAHVIDAHLPSV